MDLRTLIFALAIVHSPLAAQGQAPAASPEQVTFQSSSANDFRQLLTRDSQASPVLVRATLDFPREARERYPAVVVVHTIAGYIDANEGEMAAQLRKAGFATLTYDSFAARNTSGVALARSGPGLWPAGVADAYAALRLLENHPRIDAKRIAIAGFSYGGEIAHLTAFESLRAPLHSGRGRFAAHVAFYPAGVFGALADRPAYTGSSILMLLGGKDDNLPVQKVESYLAYARAAGHTPPVETTVYADAYHAWTVPSLTTLRFYPQYSSTKKCPLILLGQHRPEFLIDGQAKPFDPARMSKCIGDGPGYSMVYDAGAHQQSTAAAVAFLKRVLHP